jgi:processive 1,2-diacylglycerol beta-glucosyltransferase
MLKRVLILSALAGAGHVRAGQALEEAFGLLGAVEQVRHEDVLQLTNAPFRNLCSKTYIELAGNAPSLLGWLYNHSDRPWHNHSEQLALETWNMGGLVKLLDDYQPDLVISTHWMPADIMSWLTCRRKSNAQHVVVVTDLDVHALWLTQHYSHYFVAIDESKQFLERLGFEKDRITVSGIPIDPVFAIDKDKRQLRSIHGLDPDMITIMISGGGFGVGPIDRILLELGRLKRPAQVLVMCARNEELREKITSQVQASQSNGRISTRVLGYVDDIDEYMAASDLIIGKPGGLTTSEALAKGVAFVIVNPIPEQEERNSDHLLEEGAAIRCNNLPVLAYKIERLLNQPSRLMSMRQNALRLARPNAAKDIIQSVLALSDAGRLNVSSSPVGHSCQTMRWEDTPKVKTPLPEGCIS